MLTFLLCYVGKKNYIHFYCLVLCIEEELWSKLSVAALPAEEKDKLYKAIDYNESVRVKYPTEVKRNKTASYIS